MPSHGTSGKSNRARRKATRKAIRKLKWKYGKNQIVLYQGYKVQILSRIPFSFTPSYTCWDGKNRLTVAEKELQPLSTRKRHRYCEEGIVFTSTLELA